MHVRYKERNITVIGVIILILLLQAVIIVSLNVKIGRSVHHAGKVKQQKKQLNRTIISDLHTFPVPAAFRSEITYEDSYGAGRIQGSHEGCDLLDTQNTEGRIPVVSATDGEVTNIGWLYLGGYRAGWLEKGGWRIGIRSDNGNYYYYAHLSSYAGGMEVGKKVQAGEWIGFMGSTGEGEEGTKGKFPVHLHFGIYYQDGTDEKAVDPYPYLLKIEE